jgi:dynein heavy chain
VDHQSPKFCLNDIIALELFRFGDDVNELVDGAQREAKIEVKLENIEKTWEDNDFVFKDYKETKIISLTELDEIVEVCDMQSMEIMTMNADKNSEVFKDKLMKWQKTLKTVDEVIQTWVKVQKNWMRLEPIFLASEDIRAQLPEYTKRFEKVDIDWKALMADASEDPGVVAATNQDGRKEMLLEFQADIEICEKALSEYLDQKKKIFPRFYFVSNQALLEILSNGNNPEKVNEYVTDCFDGMKMMKFAEKGQRPYRIAEAMYSKEMEKVNFSSEFVITGAVENYLCDLERKMQDTLKEIAWEAKESTEEWEIDNPREKWLEKYCAQLALLATQVVWTEATARAFDDLESGSEMAMKEHYEKIVKQIKALIGKVRENLTPEIRLKVITIITIDVHSRDVIKDFYD